MKTFAKIALATSLLASAENALAQGAMEKFINHNHLNLSPCSTSTVCDGLHNVTHSFPTIARGTVDATTGTAMILKGLYLMGSGAVNTTIGLAQLPLGMVQTTVGTPAAVIYGVKSAYNFVKEHPYKSAAIGLGLAGASIVVANPFLGLTGLEMMASTSLNGVSLGLNGVATVGSTLYSGLMSTGTALTTVGEAACTYGALASNTLMSIPASLSLAKEAVASKISTAAMSKIPSIASLGMTLGTHFSLNKVRSLFR